MTSPKPDARKRDGGGPEDRSFFAKHQKAITAILIALLPYIGFKGYQDIDRVVNPPSNTVNVNVESLPADSGSGEVHSHGPVLSRIDVESLIKSEISKERDRNEQIYKKLESWEKN